MELRYLGGEAEVTGGFLVDGALCDVALTAADAQHGHGRCAIEVDWGGYDVGDDGVAECTDLAGQGVD